MARILLRAACLAAALLPVRAPAGDPGFRSVIATGTADIHRNSEGDVVVLKDGTLLAAWTEFQGGAHDHSEARIRSARSSDGGRTWGNQATLAEKPDGLNVMTASLLRLASGDILLFYQHKRSLEEMDVYARRSQDEGANWSAPVLLTPQPGYAVMINDRPIQLRDGRILCPMAVVSGLAGIDSLAGRKDFVTITYYSDDQGATWTPGKGLCFAPARGAMEPGLAEMLDGTLLQNIRTQTGEIWHSRSQDRGETWTVAKSWSLPAPEAPSTMVRMPGTDDLLVFHNPDPRLGRKPLVASLSRDGGETWGDRKVIEGGMRHDYAYTSATFHGDRMLLTYYEGERTLVFRSVPICSLWTFSAASVRPKAVTGPARACAGEGGAVYAVAAVPGAVSYAWTAPPDARVAEGQGSDHVRIVFGSTAGPVQVAAVLPCGVSEPASLEVAVDPPPPEPEVTLRGSWLIAPAAETYRWTRAGDTAVLGRAREFQARERVPYVVTVTDSQGCSRASRAYRPDSVPTVPAGLSGMILRLGGSHAGIYLPLDSLAPGFLNARLVDASGKVAWARSANVGSRELLEWTAERLAPGVYTLSLGVDGRPTRVRRVPIMRP